MLYFSVYKPTNDFKYIGKSSAYIGLELYYNESIQKLFLEDDFCKRVIEDIDKSKIFSPHLILSPYLGSIEPSQLSGGACTLLTLYFLCKEGRQDIFFRSSQLGDNCVKFLMELIDKYDIIMWMVHPLNISGELFSKNKDKIYSLDEDRLICDSEDFINTYNTWRYKRLEEEIASEAYSEDIVENQIKRSPSNIIPKDFIFSFYTHKYIIPLKYKINYLCGPSACGKTALVDQLKSIKNIINIGKVKSNINLDDIYLNISVPDLQGINSRGKECLIILEEDVVISHLYNSSTPVDDMKNLRKCLIESEAVFILITRDMNFFEKTIVNQDAILTVKNSEDGFTHIMEPLIENSKLERGEFSGIVFE